MVELGTDSFLAVQRRKMFLVGFVVGKMVMVIFFGSVRFTLCSKFGICLNLLPSCGGIGAGGLGVYYGTAGCLGLVVRVSGIAGLRLLVSLPRGGWNLALGAYPADLAGCWVPSDFWDEEDIALEMVDHPNIWTDGSRVDYPTGGFEVAGSGVFSGQQRLPCLKLSGVLRKNMERLWIVIVEFFYVGPWNSAVGSEGGVLGS